MRVLLLATNRELGLFRIHAMESAGMEVEFPQSEQEAVEAITRSRFDVVLVSYSLSNNTAERVIELVRQSCPTCPVVAISQTGWDDNKLQPDLTIRAEEGPAAMLEAITRLQLRGIRRVK